DAQDAGSDRSEIEPHDQRNPQRAGNQGAVPRPPAQRRRRQPAGHGEAQARRDRALEQGDPRGRHSAGMSTARLSMMTKHAIVLAIGTVAFAISGASPAMTQAYPSRLVTIILPFSAGGTTDIHCRDLHQPLV